MIPALEFNDVSRSYGRGVRVLDGVSFSVGAEDVVGLLGRNGAGKTTLINIAIGLLHPHTGSVRVFGISPAADPVAAKLRIGYVAEDQVLPPSCTVSEILALHRRLYPTWDRTFENDLLDRFGLAGNNAKIGKLSKGQARQVALVCAIAHKPELLILDEPAGGLDPAARREFLETSIQLLNRSGSAILFSSHHMNDVERLGGRVVLLDDGKVRINSSVDALREEHCVAVVPRALVPHAATISNLPGCLRVRASFDTWHVVFAATPHKANALLQSLGVVTARCEALPLEELFIELVGDDRSAAPA